METYRLGVGESIKLKSNIWGSRTVLRYAGMPSPESFSVVVAWTRGYNSAAFNLFLPIDSEGFNVLELGRVSVREVTPEHLRIVWQEGVRGQLIAGKGGRIAGRKALPSGS